MADATLESQFYAHLYAAGQADPAMNRRVLSFYLPYFAGCRLVLDVGCGEGQMLELLTERGISARGVDSDAGMVQRCQQRGLAVTCADIFEYLPAHAGAFDGIFSSNVIEHLSAQQVVDFLRLACEALRPGGVLVVATPNPESHIVHLYEFWRDATHVRLYSHHLLDFLLHYAGFSHITTGGNPHTAWSFYTALRTPPDRTTWWRKALYLMRRGLTWALTRVVLSEEVATLWALNGRVNDLSTQYTRPREVFAAGVKPPADDESLPLAGDAAAAGASPRLTELRNVPAPVGAARPRVAWFTSSVPFPPNTGGKIRSYHLLRSVTEQCDVDLYTIYHDAKPAEGIAALAEVCHNVIALSATKSWRTRDRWRRVLASLPRSIDYFQTPDSLAQAREHLEREGYALIIADEICMTPYAELAPETPSLVIRHKVDHVHYGEVARSRPLGPDKVLDILEAAKLRRYEQAHMPRYQAYLACSEDDAALIRRAAPDALASVIPNGVDLETFAPEPDHGREGAPVLLYVGSMNYYPNIDAMEFFFAAIYEGVKRAVPDVCVQIVGHSPPAQIKELAKKPGVAVLGSVPSVQPYYNQATAFVVPLRLGGGTRLKILEAMAMDLPVVSTSVGAEGLDIHPGQDILIADEPEAFMRETVRLLTDADLHARIAEGGRRLAARYDWRALGKPLADLAVQLAQRRSPGRP